MRIEFYFAEDFIINVSRYQEELPQNTDVFHVVERINGVKIEHFKVDVLEENKEKLLKSYPFNKAIKYEEKEFVPTRILKKKIKEYWEFEENRNFEISTQEV